MKKLIQSIRKIFRLKKPGRVSNRFWLDLLEKAEKTYYIEVVLTGDNCHVFRPVMIPRDNNHWRITEEGVTNIKEIRFDTLREGRATVDGAKMYLANVEAFVVELPEVVIYPFEGGTFRPLTLEIYSHSEFDKEILKKIFNAY